MTARLAVVVCLLVLLSVWAHARPLAVAPPAVDFSEALPLVFDDWVGRDAPPLDPAVAKTLGATQYVHRYYGLESSRRADGGVRIADVETDIAYYARPQAGASMHSPLNCLPGNGWQVVDARTQPLTAGGETVRVRRLVVARGGDRIAMLYWFLNRSGVVGDEYRQRLELFRNGLTRRPADAALVRVMALDTADGHASLARFTAATLPKLTAAFR